MAFVLEPFLDAREVLQPAAAAVVICAYKTLSSMYRYKTWYCETDGDVNVYRILLASTTLSLAVKKKTH